LETYLGCLLLILSFSIFYSCSDSESNVSPTDNPRIIDSRSSSRDKEWAIDFQAHLQDLYHGNPTSQTYSVKESMDGLEWLFNYTYTQSQDGVVEFKRLGYDFTVNNFDLLQFYNTIENKILLEINQNPDLKFSYISLEQEQNGDDITILSTLSFVEVNQCIIDRFPGSSIVNGECVGPFFETQRFPLGLQGGFTGGGTIEDPAYLPPECLPSECGPTNEFCGTPNYFAMEEIEDNLNVNYRLNNGCPEGQIPFYTEIREIYFFIPWHQVIPPCDQSEFDDPKACECLEADFLNCLYCELENKFNLDNVVVFPPLPEGFEIVSVNIEVDHTSFQPQSQAGTALGASLFIGIPNCMPKPPITRDEIAVLIDIVCC